MRAKGRRIRRASDATQRVSFAIPGSAGQPRAGVAAVRSTSDSPRLFFSSTLVSTLVAVAQSLSIFRRAGAMSGLAGQGLAALDAQFGKRVQTQTAGRRRSLASSVSAVWDRPHVGRITKCFVSHAHNFGVADPGPVSICHTISLSSTVHAVHPEDNLTARVTRRTFPSLRCRALRLQRPNRAGLAAALPEN